MQSLELHENVYFLLKECEITHTAFTNLGKFLLAKIITAIEVPFYK